MSINVTSLPNWRREFDPRHPLSASPQVSAGIDSGSTAGTGSECTRRYTQPKRSETPPAPAVHAAAVAARAAVEARRAGACPDVAARVYADAYVCALLEDAA